MKIIMHVLWVTSLLPMTVTVQAQIEITLRRSFIDSFQNKATIDANFHVLHAHERPNSGSKDGDLHVAGTDSRIGLPFVAEIQNAKNEDDAVDIIHQHEGNTPVALEGVWRIWCEHANNDTQHQGEPFPPITNTNPVHVFEIHPVTRIESIDLTGSLKPISGYRYKDADDAFFKYAQTRCEIEDLDDEVKITTNGVGYNYVEFWIEFLQTDVVSEDGSFVLCRIYNEDDEIVSQKMRMVFVKGSKPEERLPDLQAGEILHVIGVPRINLRLVSYRLDHADDNPDILSWNLPVEMIVVGVFRR